MATHSNTLAWKIPWTEEPGSLQSMGSQRGGRRESDTTERRHFHFPHLLLFSVYKRNWHSESDKTIRRGTSLPSSRMPSFPNKVVFLASKKKKKKKELHDLIHHLHPSDFHPDVQYTLLGEFYDKIKNV